MLGQPFAIPAQVERPVQGTAARAWRSLRLALVLSIALLALSGGVFATLDRRMTNEAWQQAEASLRADLLLIEQGIGADFESRDKTEVRERTRACAQALQVRLTLILADGTVLADSAVNPEWMDNMATRPEIVAALSQEFSSCHRMSPSTGADSLFVAKAMRRGDRLAGWIRGSLTAEHVTKDLRAIEWNMAAVIAVVALAALALGALWMHAWLRRPFGAAS